MQKIISLFQRDYDTDHRLVRNEIVPGAEWVAAGEGVATRKYDGTCCKMDNGVLFKRYDAKHGKTPPEGFIPAQEPDLITGHWPGWLMVDPDKPGDKWHWEAYLTMGGHELPDGTYELCGPKIGGNPEGYESHVLVPHGAQWFPDCPRDFEGLKKFFTEHDYIEGIVWHHPDGRMAKIKLKDFGLKRQK